MNAIQTKQDTPLPEINREQILKYLDTFGLSNELNQNEKDQFIQIAEAYQLNPFRREIYCVPYGQGETRKLSIITGYEVYLKRAERTGMLDGWHAWVEGDTEDTFKAVTEIFRKDWNHPFRHEVFWKESAQRKKDGSLTPFWRRMPKFQLRKVCISQAFRLAFPVELGGVPYTSDELPEEMTVLPSDMQTQSQITREDTSITEDTSSSRTNEKASTPNPAPTRADLLIAKLNTNSQYFTENHLSWIQNQITNDSTEENLQKMEDHIEKVIKTKSIIQPLKRMENHSKQKERTTPPLSKPSLSSNSKRQEDIPIF